MEICSVQYGVTGSKMFSFYIVVFILSISSLKCAEAVYQQYNKEGAHSFNKTFQYFDEITKPKDDLKIRDRDCQNSSNLPPFDARIDKMPASCYNSALPNDCASATQCIHRSGIYKIQVGKFYNETFYVACDDETQDGDWLVIQRRQDGTVDFYRDWSEYEKGFGNIDGEFFIGLKKLYALTNYNGPQELLVVMEDDKQTNAFAKYSSFAIDDENNSYTLRRIGKYSGTAGDSLQHQVGMKFTTKDRDNDLKPEYNCAVEFRGAWWHNECHRSNPNGNYNDNSFGKGINWYHFRGHNLSLPYIKMMIRRSKVV